MEYGLSGPVLFLNLYFSFLLWLYTTVLNGKVAVMQFKLIYIGLVKQIQKGKDQN